MIQQTFRHPTLTAAIELAEHRRFLPMDFISATKNSAIIETPAGLCACHSALKLAWNVYSLLKKNENNDLAQKGFLYVLYAHRLPVEKKALTILPTDLLNMPRIEAFRHEADPIIEFQTTYKDWLGKTQQETRKILLAEQLERAKNLTPAEKVFSPFSWAIIDFLKKGNEKLYAAAICPVIVKAQYQSLNLQRQRQ